MAQWLRQMLPDHDVVHHNVGSVEAQQSAAADLAACDAIISQYIGPDHGPLGSESLCRAGPTFVMIPNLTFTGFHPDIVYLTASGQIAASPLGAYHSKIIASCFLLGLDEQRTKLLFNSHVFSLLGYFEEFDKAEMHFDQTATQLGFSLRVRDLMAAGPFMYTINHATIEVSRELSRQAAKLINLEPRSDLVTIADDLKNDTIWPVYPQIASRIGLDNSGMTFIRHTILAQNRPREIDLETMIRESFAIYSGNRENFDFSPVDAELEQLGRALRLSY